MHKMKILYSYCVLLTLLVPLSKSTEVKGTQKIEKSNRHLNIFHNCRKTRDTDQEDVINRFEMERVSPLYDILRHLPAFEDGWLPNPVTSPVFSPPPPLRLNNESSAYGEFKIELSKDEEHVVNEGGRGFQENSALNWYYSAESYSSVNNFSRSGPKKSQFQPTSPETTKVNDALNTFTTTNSYESTSPKTTKLEDVFGPKTTKVEDIYSPKTTKSKELIIPHTVISRKIDEEHVVSHVPSLKGGRGTFLDFNLLESSTTPKVEATLSSKNEEPKPNVTTRYILLQSGRVVAINVTTVSTLFKPTSSSGSSNKSSHLPTFYFGSRIRNKNTTNSLLTNTTTLKDEKVLTKKPSKVLTTVELNTKLSTDYKKVNPQKVTTVPTTKPVEVRTTTNKRTSHLNSVTIKPFVEYARTQKLKNSSVTEKLQITKQTTEPYSSQQMKQTGRTNKSHTVKQIPDLPLSQNLKDNPSIKDSQQIKDISPVTQVPSLFLRETTPFDPAQQWWNEMKAAKLQRSSLIVTTEKPKLRTISSQTVFESLAEALRPLTEKQQHTSKPSDLIKNSREERISYPAIEMAVNARNGKNKMSEKNALHFSTTSIPHKIPHVSAQSKSTKPWTTFESDTSHDKKRQDILTSTPEEDILEPSIPLSNVQHDFVRIVTVSPPVTVSPDFKTLVTSVTPKENKASSRRPRYRGLSHVNLQVPVKPQTSTVPPKFQVNTPSTHQLTTVPPRRSINIQSVQRGNTVYSSTPSSQTEIVTPATPRRSRNGFYLRNSVTFQTSPPGSLTDRRTLTREEHIETSTRSENYQPPLEDLLIISFEPTRKTMGENQNVADRDTQIEEKPRNFRVPPRKENPPREIPLLTTAKPYRRVTEKSPDDSHLPERTQSRVGRNFRNNNPKQQVIVSRVESTSPLPVTTRQEFRVYYFEPKRRKTGSEESTKNVKPIPSQKSTERPTRTNTDRVVSLVNNRGQSEFRERNRNVYDHNTPTNVHNHQRPSNARSPKQLQLPVKERTSTTEVVTTPRPTGKKLKSSPFIWHKPNVGLHKRISQDDEQFTSSEIDQEAKSSSENNSHRGYRALQRTG